MAKATVSFHTGSKHSLAHNRRLIEGEEHIDYALSDKNIVFVRNSPQKMYQELFLEAIQEHNERQTRNDRKVDILTKDEIDASKIYAHVRKMGGRPREAIIAIGRYDDELDPQLKTEILKEYWADWQKRNPNLKVIDAGIHMDEAQPHLHIVYLPVFDNSNGKGLSVGVAFDKALAEQQGLEYDRTLKKSKYINPYFDRWRSSEVQKLENLLKAHGIEKIASEGPKRAHMTQKEYQKMMAVQRELEHQVRDLNEQNKILKERIQYYGYEVRDNQVIVEGMRVLRDMAKEQDLEEYAPIITTFTNAYFKARNQQQGVFESLVAGVESVLPKWNQWKKALIDRFYGPQNDEIER